jgi:hypothetical protein
LATKTLLPGLAWIEMFLSSLIVRFCHMDWQRRQTTSARTFERAN